MNLILFLLAELQRAIENVRNGGGVAGHKSVDFGVRRSGAGPPARHLLGSVVGPLVRSEAQLLAQCPFSSGDTVQSRASSGIKAGFKNRVGTVSSVFQEFDRTWCMVVFSENTEIRFAPHELERIEHRGSDSGTSLGVATSKQKEEPGLENLSKSGTATTSSGVPTAAPGKPLAMVLEGKGREKGKESERERNGDAKGWERHADAFEGVEVWLPPNDPRTQHVRSVIKAKDGDSLRVGLINGGIGYATMRWMDLSDVNQEEKGTEETQTTSTTPESKPEPNTKRQKTSRSDGTESSLASSDNDAPKEDLGVLDPVERGVGIHDDSKISGLGNDKGMQNTRKKRQKQRAKKKKKKKEKNDAITRSSPYLLVKFGRLEPVPPMPEIHVILAHPRPRVLAKMWSILAQLAVRQIIVLNASKCDKQYWYSDKGCLKENLRLPLLLEGLQQGGHTQMPNVHVERYFKPFVEDKLDEMMPQNSVRLLCDLGKHPSVRDLVKDHKNKPVVLAIGPEGGWTQFEVESLKAKGFQTVSLGPLIMRVDVACIAAIAVVSEQLNYLKRTSEGGGNHAIDLGTESAATRKRLLENA